MRRLFFEDLKWQDVTWLASLGVYYNRPLGERHQIEPSLAEYSKGDDFDFNDYFIGNALPRSRVLEMSICRKLVN